MQEKTSIEKLGEFAKEMGYSYYTHSNKRNHLIVAPAERFTKAKYIVIDLKPLMKDLFLVFFDVFSPKAYTGETYCGLFHRLSDCENEIKIIRRDWFDFLSFKKRHKFGDSFIDKKVTIFKDNNESIPLKINPRNIRKFIEINKQITPLEIVTIKNSLSIVPELHHNNWIALQINRHWLVDTTKLQYFIQEGAPLLKSMISPYHPMD